MKLRALPFAVSTAVLLTSSFAVAQVYEVEERRVIVDQNPPREMVFERETPPPRALTSTDVARVEERRSQVLQRDMVGRKLSATDYRELRRQRSEVDRLIARMRAGHPVSGEQVDQALGLYTQNRPGY